MRHKHPEVTPLEWLAIQFLFDCLDSPTAMGILAAQQKAKAALGEAGGSALTGGKKGGKKGKAGGKGGKGGAGGFGAAPKGFGAAKKA